MPKAEYSTISKWWIFIEIFIEKPCLIYLFPHGIGSFMENLLAAFWTTAQMTSVVRGANADSRGNVNEHRRWRAISSRSDVRYLPVEVAGKSFSRKPTVGDRCCISTPTQTIIYCTPQKMLGHAECQSRSIPTFTGPGDALLSTSPSNCHEQHQCATSWSDAQVL